MNARGLLIGTLLILPVLAAALPAPPLPLLDHCPPPDPAGPDVVAFNATMDDDAVLRGHVYLPRDAPRPLSTVLTLSPYWGLFDGTTACLPFIAQDKFLAAGFAVAFISARGTGDSDGCLQWGGPRDAADTAAVVEALAAAPWSNRAVGMFGGSYDGMLAILGAGAAPPALKAVVAVSAPVDQWTLHTRNGAPWMVGGVFPSPLGAPEWVLGTSFELFRLVEPNGLPSPHPLLPTPSPARALCPNDAEITVEAALLLARGDRDAYWDGRDARPALATSRVPVLATVGTNTITEEMVTQIDLLWDALPAGKHVIIGPWDHLGMPDGFETTAVAWFDHHLRGGPATVAPDVVAWQDELLTWHTSPRWPPPAREVTLRLSGGQLVPDGAPVAASEQTFQSVWADPCPGVCVRSAATLKLPVCGPFQALWVSEPLAEDVLLAGNVRVALTLTSTLPDGNLAAFLLRTDNSGQCPDTSAVEVRRALGSLRHLASPYGADFPLESPTPVALDSYPLARYAFAGQRLVLAVGGDSVLLVPKASKPLLTVTTGDTLAGSVTLPVAEGDVRFSGFGSPTDLANKS